MNRVLGRYSARLILVNQGAWGRIFLLVLAHSFGGTAQAEEVYRSSWDSVPDSVIQPIAACCGTDIAGIRASGVPEVPHDPVMGYNCPLQKRALPCLKAEIANPDKIALAMRSWLGQLPPEARGVLQAAEGCGSDLRDLRRYLQCAQAALRRPESKVFQAVRSHGGSPAAALSATGAFMERVIIQDASSMACDRLQGNVRPDPAKKGRFIWGRADPECLPRYPAVDFSSAPFMPVPRDITQASVLGDLALLAASPFRSTDSERDSAKPRSVTDPVVNLNPFGIGFTRRECPKFLDDMGCVPLAGPWSPQVGPPGGDAISAPLDVDRAYPGLRDVMFGELSQHAIGLMAETYISSLMVLNPSDLSKVSRKKEDFLRAASCLPASARGMLDAKFQSAGGASFPRKVELHRARLGRDLLETAKRVRDAEQLAKLLEPQFKNNGPCGFIAQRFNDPSVNSGCRGQYAEWKAAERIRDEGFANYPIFAEELDGRPMLSKLAEARTPEDAIRLHDHMLQRVTDATLERVRATCDDPMGIGKIAALNPLVARSYIEKNPDAAWVFCAAYAEIGQNEDLKGVAKATFLGASLLVTGGWSGLVFAGLSTGMTLHDLASRHEAAVRDQQEYLAGVGNVAAYLDARKALDDFYLDAGVDLGLEALGLAPELGVLKSWGEAERLGRLGQTALLSAKTQTALVGWYRGRLGTFFGDAVKKLSDAEAVALARLEESGLDLSKLQGAACAL